MEHTFSLKVKDTAGLLARVEAVFRRQGVPLRRISFEEGTEAAAASLVLVAETDETRSSLLKKQLMRLHDVREVFEGDRPRAVAGSRERLHAAAAFVFQEKTA